MFRKTFISLAGLLLLFIIACAGCDKTDESKKINLGKREELKTKTEQPGLDPIRVAVGGMITPKEGFVYYREFLDYVEEKLGRKVEYIDKEKYDEINMLLKSGGIDLAFVCSGPYVDGHREFGMELLVAPEAHGETVYYSYIIVHKDSHIKSFNELRGKRFAFTDPLSNSGKLVPDYMLARMGETPDTFFGKYLFTYAHDKSIKAVAQGVVDGAAVDSLIWEYINSTHPEFTSKTRTIMKSPPYGIPPVAVRKGLAPELKKRLRQIFLNAHKDKKATPILKGMMIDKFVLIDDRAYDSIREMKAWVAGEQMKKKKAK